MVKKIVFPKINNFTSEEVKQKFLEMVKQVGDFINNLKEKKPFLFEDLFDKLFLTKNNDYISYPRIKIDFKELKHINLNLNENRDFLEAADAEHSLQLQSACTVAPQSMACQVNEAQVGIASLVKVLWGYVSKLWLRL
jgi:hypothetical protein